MNRKTVKQRVEKEQSKLFKKITKLEAFIWYSNVYREELSAHQQDLLQMQLNAMYNYVSILEMRLKALGETAE